jgi:hypothetical protein
MDQIQVLLHKKRGIKISPLLKIKKLDYGNSGVGSGVGVGSIGVSGSTTSG